MVRKLSTTKTFPKDFGKISKNPGRCGFSKNTKTFPKDFQKTTRPEQALGPGLMLPGHPVILSIFSKEYKRAGGKGDATRHLCSFRDFLKDSLCGRYKGAILVRDRYKTAKNLSAPKKTLRNSGNETRNRNGASHPQKSQRP